MRREEKKEYRIIWMAFANAREHIKIWSIWLSDSKTVSMQMVHDFCRYLFFLLSIFGNCKVFELTFVRLQFDTTMVIDGEVSASGGGTQHQIKYM